MVFRSRNIPPLKSLAAFEVAARSMSFADAARELHVTGVAVRQGIAMTGAIDQHGHIQPIGAVNEKIEGFFDLCAHLGLDGSQGVIIRDPVR